MSNLTTASKKLVKMKVLSTEEQAKIKGGTDLPKWLEKMMNRRMID